MVVSLARFESLFIDHVSVMAKQFSARRVSCGHRCWNLVMLCAILLVSMQALMPAT